MNLGKVVLLLLVFYSGLPCAPEAALAKDLRIEFTQVPRAGEGADSQGDIAGRVVGLDAPQRYKVVLYAHTDWWYVQPLAADPYTDIGTDGTWSNWTHLGKRYAAMVVKPSFHVEAKLQALPHVCEQRKDHGENGCAIARAEVPALEK